MKRIHLHLSVENLASSIQFYNTLFGAQPSVEKPDYAKWMLTDPFVNFAISQRGAKPGLDHIGIQTDEAAELVEIKHRLDTAQVAVQTQEGVTCCYAQSDKHWVQDPSGIAWETFNTLADAPTFQQSEQMEAQSACCAPTQTVQFKPFKGKDNDDKQSSCC